MPLQPRFAVNYKTIKFPQPQTNEIHLRVQIFSVVSHKVNIQILALLLELKKITTASPFLLLLPSWMDPFTDITQYQQLIVLSTLQQLHTAIDQLHDQCNTSRSQNMLNTFMCRLVFLACWLRLEGSDQG